MSIISSYNFAPTMKAKENLISEGKKEDNIWITGNTVIDALKTTVREDYVHPDVKALYPIHMNPVVRQAADEEVIYNNFKELLENQEAYNAMAKANNPYGDGKACIRIADILEKRYTEW